MIDVNVVLNELIGDEAIRRYVYDDANGHRIVPGYKLIGHPTIGIGRALDVNGITDNEARTLAVNDICLYLDELDLRPWFAALDPVRQCAILSMRHQLGLTGLLNFRDMIAALQAKDWGEAARAGLASTWHTQTPERAERLMAMIRTGASPNSTVGV